MGSLTPTRRHLEVVWQLNPTKNRLRRVQLVGKVNWLVWSLNPTRGEPELVATANPTGRHLRLIVAPRQEHK